MVEVAKCAVHFFFCTKFFVAYYGWAKAIPVWWKVAKSDQRFV